MNCTKTVRLIAYTLQHLRLAVELPDMAIHFNPVSSVAQNPPSALFAILPEEMFCLVPECWSCSSPKPLYATSQEPCTPEIVKRAGRCSHPFKPRSLAYTLPSALRLLLSRVFVILTPIAAEPTPQNPVRAQVFHPQY